MVAKSNRSDATQHATQRLEKVIESHRSYFSEWRSTKFERPNDEQKSKVASSHPKSDRQK